MIPDKIQALFDFIDFIDQNKNEYINKYIPLCNELSELDRQRSILNPRENYKEKELYESIQRKIESKFSPINENIYKPVTSKLKELGIWSGDYIMTSIYNNNISEILEFHKNFSTADLQSIMRYKKKYISFRSETNNDFMCLALILRNLDEVYKMLFDYFKDTKENEFEPFEKKIVKLNNFEELTQHLKVKEEENVSYSFPLEFLANKEKKLTSEKYKEVKNYNVYNIGDNIRIGKLSKNKGQIKVGKNITGNEEADNGTALKSFRWQKREAIIMIIIGVIGVIIAIFSLVK